MRIFISIILFSVGSIVAAQLTGPSTVDLNSTRQYSFSNGFLIMNGNWEVIGDADIISTSQNGSTYYVNIKWTSSGSRTVKFKNGLSTTLAQKSVTVLASPALSFSYGGFIDGTSVVKADNNTVLLNVKGHLGDIIKWEMAYDGDFSTIDATYSHSDSSFTYNDLDQTAYFRAVTVHDSDTLYSNTQSVLVLESNDDNFRAKRTQYGALKQVASVTDLDKSNAVRTIQYADGFGRSVQNQTYDYVRDKTVISFANYDSLGRVKRNYLPYISTLDAFEEDPVAAQSSYYANPGTGVESSSFPFAEAVYDERYQRVVEQGSPGADWQIGSGHTVSYDYGFNVTNEVRKWSFTGTPAGTYAAGKLRKVEMNDENGHKVITYTDDLGQTILKKVEKTTNVYLSTYSIYNELGRLIHTVPPKALEMMEDAGNYNISLGTIADLIFSYKYDTRGRLIERKVPGKGKEYIIYDRMSRPILRQDTSLRAKGQWLFVKYDIRGRSVLTGLHSIATDVPTLRTEVQNSTAKLYESFDAAGAMQYTNEAYPLTNGSTDFLSATYYDNYDYQASWTEDLSFDKPGDETSTANHSVITEDHTITQAEASSAWMYLEGVTITIPHTVTLMDGFELVPVSQEALDNAGIQQAPSTRGLATGSITKAENQWLKAAVYYDEDLQVAQSQQTNHLGGKDIATVYREPWTNRVLKTIHSHTDGNDLITITQGYAYDELGRLLETTHQINDEEPQILNQNAYHDLGHVIEKNIGNSLQSIDYAYNIRGWLTSINDPSLGSEDDLFGMTLAYNTTETGLGNAKQYNGNIGAMKWSSYDADGTGITERGYAYTYDAADRMTNANHKSKNTTWTNPTAYDVSGVYDANGNIQNLNRDGTDALTYAYTNNQLMSVSDTQGAEGFTDGNTSGDDYAYDTNGNMTKDLNKGIDQIRYNYLDKPVSIVLSGSEADSLTYTYSASGSKLGMQVWKDGTEQSTVDYIGGFRYEDGALKSFAHSEGRIVLKEVNNETKYDYRYHLTDHQGNTRRVLSTLHEEYTSTENFEGGDNGFTDLHIITNSNANTTAGGSKVERLQIAQTGAMVLLKVDKRDTIDLKVQANYESAPSGNTFVSIASSVLFNSWDNAFGSGVEGGVGNGASGEFQDAFSNGMGGKNSSNTAPRAYLNYILFDLEMNYVTAGFQQISTSAQGIGAHELIAINDIIASKSGYLFAYLSNENSDAVDVHFDDFEVRHAKTNVVQAVDYYPFGMEAMTYTRTAADPTKYLYNGGVEKNNITSYYETFYRQYDASIGRFTGIDVKASSFSSLTPYNYAFNDPVTYNDPLGDCPTCSGRPGSLLDEIIRRNKSGNCFTCDGGGSGGNGGAGFSGMRSSGGYGGYAYGQYEQNIRDHQQNVRDRQNFQQAKKGDPSAVMAYAARYGVDPTGDNYKALGNALGIDINEEGYWGTIVNESEFSNLGRMRGFTTIKTGKIDVSGQSNGGYDGPSWFSVLGSRLSEDARASYNRYLKWQQPYGETQWNSGKGGEGFSDKANITGNCINCAPSYGVDPSKKGLDATAKLAKMLYNYFKGMGTSDGWPIERINGDSTFYDVGRDINDFIRVNNNLLIINPGDTVIKPINPNDPAFPRN